MYTCKQRVISGGEGIDQSTVPRAANHRWEKQLSPELKTKLRKLLQANLDIFAWEYGDITGIPRVLNIQGKDIVTEHRFNGYKHLEPIHQKKRNLASNRDEASCKEVDELFKAGIIREAKYPTRVANPITVKKSDGGWRKWPRKMKRRHLYTSKGIFCYRKMPFGLKNVGATYQRLVDKAFHKQFGRNLEAYVDDMVIKSVKKTNLLADIQETLDTLRAINMKLNPKKCSFGVEEEKFLGYYITKKGIQANPEKVDKIKELKAPTTLKEIQSLN
ncbi:uncharacterized protein [Rutidosis leptorrhynchoides]|uniref:uncharacterized protein n=1 Tax=Rutidosis leptorrhynchoides TaxID=125765 RepID=UPI003A999A2E